MYYLYCLTSEYIKQHGKRKLGCSESPIQRMRTYNTGDAPGIRLEKYYEGIWQVNAISTVDLYRMEALLHSYFESVREKYTTGNKSEWFNVIFEDVEAFLNQQDYVQRQLSIDEITEIHRKAEYIEEIITLKNKFFATFLPGKVPRRVQDELWDTFENISNDELLEMYRGIVQWPTGVGKTIAMLLIIVLIKEGCVRKGIIYKGLLLSRTNDIFDTIKKNFSGLSEFGIKICDGTRARLSKLDFPEYTHILIIATHSALIQEGIIESLPNITHFHYDEVHRIGGEILYTLLPSTLEKWGTQFLTGTSATPLTSSASQREKITSIFGNPINIIHQCGVEEAVKEGWIAQPRFIVVVGKKTNDKAANIEEYVDAVIQTITKKNNSDGFKGGKCISYLEDSIQSVIYAYEYAKKTYPTYTFYCAAGDFRNDTLFCEEKYSGIPMILFVCQRYLEGSDILGIEMTTRFVGNSITAHSIIQVSGRALRLDYPGKEGWCMIFRPSEEGTTSNDILDSIVLDILDLMGKSDKLYEKKEFLALIKTYMGNLSIDGKEESIAESVKRIHEAYMRRVFPKRSSKEKYTMIRDINREMGLKSKNEYIERANEHSRYIEDPPSYFGYWNCWYDYLGIDCSKFPQTKADWVRVCKERGFITWDYYKEKRDDTLPCNPGELYWDFTNWDKEFGIVEEVVW